MSGQTDPNAMCYSFTGGVQQAGNEIMGNPKVFVVYWDVWFVQNPDVVQRMNQCISEIITEPYYMDGLAQYQISLGEFNGWVVIDSTQDVPPNPMTQGHLEWHIFNWIANKTIPFTGDYNQLFAVFTPSGVVLEYQGLNSGPGGQFSGYHAGTTYNPPLNWGKNNLFYAAIPSVFFPPLQPSSSNFLMLQSSAVSHEMVESFTDRNGNGWISSNQCEIADLCAAAPNNTIGPISINGWPVARFWSNALSSCYPAASLPLKFVAIYDQNVFDGIGVPAAIFSKMQELANAGHGLRKVVLAPGGGWIVICDDTYWNQGFPKPAYELIDSICDRGGTLVNVVFDPDGNWALMFDDIIFEEQGNPNYGNYFFGPGFSPAVVSTVVARSGFTLLDIDFAPNGSAIVVGAGNAIIPVATGSTNFPGDASLEISNQTGGTPPRLLTSVCFAPNWERILNFADETPDPSPDFPGEVTNVLNQLAAALSAPGFGASAYGPGFRSLTFFL